MTGSYNRRFMDQELHERLAEHIRRREPMGFLFVDVDSFKGINDRHGHQVGDEAIRRIARILHENVRESDFVIRYGGDEFLVSLMKVTERAMREIAERICVKIENVQLKQHPQVCLTTSVGVIHYQPHQGDLLDANWLIDHVDKAMYEAKRGGGNQVRFYHVQGEAQPQAGEAVLRK